MAGRRGANKPLHHTNSPHNFAHKDSKICKWMGDRQLVKQGCAARPGLKLAWPEGEKMMRKAWGHDSTRCRRCANSDLGLTCWCTIRKRAKPRTKSRNTRPQQRGTTKPLDHINSPGNRAHAASLTWRYHVDGVTLSWSRMRGETEVDAGRARRTGNDAKHM